MATGIWISRLVLGVSVVMAACTPIKPYHVDPDPIARANGQTVVSKETLGGRPVKAECDDVSLQHCVSTVEYDDFGFLYNRAQLNRTLASAERIASHGAKENRPHGGVIIVYVHGWRHNSHEDDSDYRKFRDSIKRISALNRESFNDDRKVMGIYVGWRGLSVDLMPLTYLSFWDRKNTAHAVGNGAVYELFKKLSDIRKTYPTSRLVLVGHSLGSAVIYSATWSAVLSQIIDDPLPEAGPINTGNVPKRWDMIVLVNSALEAMQVRSHYEAMRSRKYAIGQLPHLIFVTTEADDATRVAFRAGRWVSTMFKAYPEWDTESDVMNQTAIGHYIPYVTHQLSTIPRCKEGNIEISKVNRLEHVVNAPTYCFGDPRTLTGFASSAVGQVKIDPPYMVRCDARHDCAEVAGDHYILRSDSPSKDATMVPTPERVPIMNIRTTSQIMKDHGDFLNPTMQSFLFQFIMLTVTPTADNDVETNVSSMTKPTTKGK